MTTPTSSGRSRTAEALIDRSSGLVILHGLPGSGRSGLVAWWLRSRGLTDHQYAWVNATLTTPDTLIAEQHERDAIVIDHIPPESSEAWAQCVAALVHAGVQVIVLVGPGGEFPTLVVDRTVIGPLDLAWVTDDVKGHLKARDLRMDDRLIAELLQQTGGWASLIVEAAEAYRAGSTVTDLEAGLHRASMVLTERLSWLSSKDPFWQAMALDPQLSAEMLEAMCAEPVRERIRQATHSGIARMVGTGRTGGIALIPLVRDHLYQEATQKYPAAIARLHLRLSSWSEEQDDPPRALRHAQSAGDRPAVARILDRSWPEILAAEGFAALQGHLAGLLIDETTSSTGLRHLAELFGMRPLSRVELPIPRSADELARAAATGHGHRLLRNAAAAMMANRSQGRIDVAARLAEAFDPLANACLNATASRSGFSPFWYLQTGITHTLNYDLPRALIGFERAWAYRAQDELGFVGRAAGLRAALLRCVQGLPREAEGWLERGRAEHSSCPALTRYVDAPEVIFRHARAVDTLDLQTAEAIHSSEFAHSEDDELWPLRLWSQFRWLVNIGEVSRALITIEDAVAAGGPADGLRHAMPLTLTAHLMLFVDRAETAMQLLASSEMNTYDQLVDARIKLLSGEFDEALAAADRGIAATHLFPRMSVSFEATGIAAAAALGDDAAVRTRLQAVIETAAQGDIPIALAELPRQVLEMNTDIDGVSEIILRLYDAGVGPSSWPESVALIRLTARERVILRAMHDLSTVKAIADHLVVSVNTVKSQQRTLYRKLGATNREEALGKSHQLGLLK